ncbi:MAG: DUF3347 domain-containing protein [Deltaproteobacteria bacterium]|nr:DUF3347 domain-containing protein [Deltaproteobacteria bacterium]
MRRIIEGIILLIATALPLSAKASSARFDKAMQPVLTKYLAIQSALASDSTASVANHAKQISLLAKKISAKGLKGEHAKQYAQLPQKLVAAAATLAKAKDVAAMRESFKALSRPMALWATLSKPSDVNVVFCSMAKASWLQRDKAVRNPYYGKKMLACGEIISGPGKGHAGGHMQH